MNESGADIFWVGLGAPKQEVWMYDNYKKLKKNDGNIRYSCL